MAANSEDVRGLHLEAESYEELVNELRDIGSYLLRKNHGLTEEELLNVVIIFKLDSRQEPLQSDVEIGIKILWSAVKILNHCLWRLLHD